MAVVERKTILLVEDEAIFAMTGKLALERYGYNVVTATTGEKAIETFNMTPGIDLILMDIDLGTGTDGTQTAELILKDRDIPIVFLSSHSEREVVEKTEAISSYGYVVKSSSITVLDASIKMALKLFEANCKLGRNMDALRKSTDQYKLVTSLTSDYAYKIGIAADGEISLDFVSDSFHEITGRSLDEVKSLESWKGIFHPDDSGKVSAFLRKLLGSQQTGEMECRTFVKANQLRWISIVARSEWDDQQKRVIGIVGAVKDITDRKLAENALQESEEKYRAIIEQSLDGIVITDEHWIITDWNESQASITGISAEEALGKFVYDIQIRLSYDGTMTPELKAKLNLNLKDLVAAASEWKGETRESIIRCADGSRKVIFETIFVIKTADTARLGVITRDITDRKLSEENVNNLLEEKELIIKEVHHRIKNNVNVINSLLSLQARNAKERSTVTALEDVRARVRSMMLLYDKLCQFGAFDEISMGKYLPPLISEIVANFPGGASVRVVTDIDDFSLDVKKIQSIGILVNELLSNIMKHAFTGTMDGRVFVSAKIDGRHVVMVIKDNGVGMPDTFDFENSPGMGLLLVKGLVLQLAGSIRMERGKGTAFILEFDV